MKMKPQKLRQTPNEEDLKNDDSLKYEDFPKHEDNLKNDDDPKNEDNDYNEDGPKNFYIRAVLCTVFYTASPSAPSL